MDPRSMNCGPKSQTLEVSQTLKQDRPVGANGVFWNEDAEEDEDEKDEDEDKDEDGGFKAFSSVLTFWTDLCP